LQHNSKLHLICMLVCYKDIIENINDLMLVIILHLIMTV